MEDAERRRQLMLKNPVRPQPKKKNPNDDDTKGAALVTALDTQRNPTKWIANKTCKYGNPIIAAFPRPKKPEQPKKLL